MYLVQLLLPLRDNDGVPFPRADFERVRAELTERHGGVTAYLRSPASGVWRDEGGEVARDAAQRAQVGVTGGERRGVDADEKEVAAAEDSGGVAAEAQAGAAVALDQFVEMRLV